MTWEVDTVEPDEDLAAAAQLMLDNKYGCLPVVEDGSLTGILTEADFVRFVVDRCTSWRNDETRSPALTTPHSVADNHPLSKLPRGQVSP